MGYFLTVIKWVESKIFVKSGIETEFLSINFVKAGETIENSVWNFLIVRYGSYHIEKIVYNCKIYISLE